MENNQKKVKETNPSLIIRIELDEQKDRWVLWLDSADEDAPPPELVAEVHDLEYMWSIAQHLIKRLETTMRNRHLLVGVAEAINEAGIFAEVRGATPRKES